MREPRFMDQIDAGDFIEFDRYKDFKFQTITMTVTGKRSDSRKDHSGSLFMEAKERPQITLIGIDSEGLPLSRTAHPNDFVVLVSRPSPTQVQDGVMDCTTMGKHVDH
jgi:hypothetical protein